MALVAMARSDMIRRFAELRARLEHSPADSDAAFDLAEVASLLRCEEEALPLVTMAAETVGTSPALWQWKALLHRALDQNIAAISAFDRASRLSPADAKIAHGRARTALEAGLPAMALFDHAHRLAPNDGDILLGRASAQLAEGDLPAAIAGIDNLLVRNPGWMAGHELVSHLRWLSGDHNSFAISLDRALAIASADPALWHMLIVLLIHAGQHDRARDVIHRGRSLAGPQLFFDVNEAIVASEQGDIMTADRLFASLEAVDDMTVAVRHIRHLLRTRRIEQAAALAESRTGDPDSHLIWPYLGTAWRLLGDPRWDWLEGDPRLVGTIDLTGMSSSLDRLAACLQDLHIAPSQQLDQSVRGGTQTEGALFARIDPELCILRAAIVDAVAQHIAQLPPYDPAHPTLGQPRPHVIRFNGSWSVRLNAQGHHAHHIHPDGWLSSAFYVALPSEAQRGPAPAGWLALGKPQAELGLDLAATRMIEPQPGRLVLFPSTMWHGTLPFEGGERLTVAFDVAAGVREEDR
jgi:tetratricopeptide (TPR) repeat protein